MGERKGAVVSKLKEQLRMRVGMRERERERERKMDEANSRRRKV